MLVGAAVLPHPPLLVPEVASGAVPELEPLRRACDDAVASVLAAAPDLVAVVGVGPVAAEHSPGATGSLHGYGVEVGVRLGDGPVGGPASLPLSLTVGAWLLERARWTGRVVGIAVTEDTPPAAAASLGRELVARADRVGLLVMGDGSARMSQAAPGYVDPQAPAFEAGVAAALADGDAAALTGLDAEAATELLAVGRAPWQVLAGAASGPVVASLLAHEAPYGVDYLVATWQPRDGQ